MELTGKSTDTGSLLPEFGFWGLNSGCQTWRQAPYSFSHLASLKQFYIIDLAMLPNLFAILLCVCVYVNVRMCTTCVQESIETRKKV